MVIFWILRGLNSATCFARLAAEAAANAVLQQAEDDVVRKRWVKVW